MSSVGQAQHVFLLDRLKGTYRDAGPATKVDKFAAMFSAGRIRIGPAPESTATTAAQSNSGQGVAAVPSGYDGVKRG